jgi:anti-sigma-K factor RskA
MDPAGSYTHEELEVLVSAHALDALEPAEADAVQAHLAGCASCRAAFDEALETAAALALGVPGAEPPADLRDRILTAARATPQDSVAPAAAAPAAAAPAAQAVGAPAARPRRRFREIFTPSRNFAAAFALAAALLGVLFLSERDRTGKLEAERDSAALVSQALAAPGARVVALSGPGGTGGGAVVLASDRKPLVVADLLPAPPGKVWEVWTIPPDGKPVSVGLMRGGPENVLELPQQLDPTSTVAITPEPDDGTQHAGPTGSIALSGGLS